LKERKNVCVTLPYVIRTYGCVEAAQHSSQQQQRIPHVRASSTTIDLQSPATAYSDSYFIMTVYSLLIFDRKGKTLFTKTYSSSGQQTPANVDDEEEYLEEKRKLIFGMLFSLRELTGNLGPEGVLPGECHDITMRCKTPRNVFGAFVDNMFAHIAVLPYFSGSFCPNWSNNFAQLRDKKRTTVSHVHKQ